MKDQKIWKPIEFDPSWGKVDLVRFNLLYPSWEGKRTEFEQEGSQYDLFIEQLKRRQAIDTGILERMYNLSEGVTETFIREGFVESYLQHGDSDVSSELLMGYLQDNLDAINFVFSFVKEERTLSTSYIKEMHHLVTKHQETSTARDQHGKLYEIPLLKGAYKTRPNNPVRDGIRYCYCPPEQVDIEMEKLVELYNTRMQDCPVIVKAAFLHHAFTQIHPFQDGNGRMARLLASFVLIKEGLFPLAIDRRKRERYIRALEQADEHCYQGIIDVFVEDQLESMQQALNWETPDLGATYDEVLEQLNQKIGAAKKHENGEQMMRIKRNMHHAYEILCKEVDEQCNYIPQKVAGLDVGLAHTDMNEETVKENESRLNEFATKHTYHINAAYPKCWSEIYLSYNKETQYRLVFCLHHYGYDRRTFAIGAFLTKELFGKEALDTSVNIAPLVFSAEKEVRGADDAIRAQVKMALIATMAYISGEL